MHFVIPALIIGFVLMAVGAFFVLYRIQIALQVANFLRRRTKVSGRLNRPLSILSTVLGTVAAGAGLAICFFGQWWWATAKSTPHLYLAPGQSVTLPMKVSFDPEPWPWHASDLMLSTVAQIIPLLLIAVGGLAFVARRNISRARSWFWVVTLTGLILVTDEAFLLYEMGLTIALRWPMVWIYVLVFILPTLFSLVILRLALWPADHAAAPSSGFARAPMATTRPPRLALAYNNRRARRLRAARSSRLHVSSRASGIAPPSA